MTRCRHCSSLFFTGSYAEYHWPEVRRVLATAARDDGDVDLCDDIEQGKVHLAIRRYEALLNELFEQRRKFFFFTVVQRGLLLHDFFCKIEFGSHGGAVHFHALGWGGANSQQLQQLMDDLPSAASLGQVEILEAAVAHKLERIITRVP